MHLVAREMKFIDFLLFFFISESDLLAEYLDDAFVTYRTVLDTSNFDVKFVDN